jgi:hypothetical protein
MIFTPFKRNRFHLLLYHGGKKKELGIGDRGSRVSGSAAKNGEARASPFWKFISGKEDLS